MGTVSGVPDPEVLLGVQRRPEQPDPHSEWCDTCQRWHQLRERPHPCEEPGCRALTGRYHGRCPAHG